MSNLSFLSNITLEPVVVATKAKKPGVVKLPENADLRVFATGKIYPSKAFAEKHNLEYQPRVEVDGKITVLGNGLDIFRGTQWEMIKAQLGPGQDAMFISVVEKQEPKVDVFGSCRYEDDGTPKSSVLTQGDSTFVKTKLVDMIAEVLGVSWESTPFVDLKVEESIVMKSPNDVYYLPKTVSSGANKGQDDVVRRQNIIVNALVLADSSEEAINEGTEAPELETADSDGQDWAEALRQ